MYDNKLILIEWYSGFVGEIYKYYTKPSSGEPLIYLSPNPVFTYKYSGLGINKMTPWAEQMNFIIQW